MSETITNAVGDANLKVVGDVGVAQLFALVDRMIADRERHSSEESERHSMRMERARDHHALQMEQARDHGTLRLQILTGAKIIEEKLLDPGATEVAQDAIAAAQSISTLTSTDVKTLSDMNATMMQILSAIRDLRPTT